MGRLEDRVKGYYGHLVDGKKLAVIAKKIYALQYGESVDCAVSDLLLVEGKEKDFRGINKYAVVCEEGVGWEQNDYGLIPVPTNIGMGLWNGKVFMSPKVVQSCLTPQVIDIADFVRVFGDRLDNNVAIWQGFIGEPNKKINYLVTSKK